MAKEHFKFDFEEWMAEELIHRDDWKDWYHEMLEVLPLWEVDTIERVAGFIAQCGHESGGFRVLTENLNYSASALNKIFGKYFVRAGRDPQPYHRQPEKIANVIYASRMDNGDTDSGDGWRFRGGGILQLTGRYNYTQFAKEMEMTPEEAVDYVRTKKGALDSACWFWDTNNINKYCDNQDIVGMTKRINGGYIGLEDRIHHWKEALHMLGSDVSEHESDDEFVEEPSPEDIGVLRKGMKSVGVVMMQEALGITADGDFGPGTERALKEWQSANGLVADGIAGPATLGELLV